MIGAIRKLALYIRAGVDGLVYCVASSSFPAGGGGRTDHDSATTHRGHTES